MLLCVSLISTRELDAQPKAETVVEASPPTQTVIQSNSIAHEETLNLRLSGGPLSTPSWEKDGLEAKWYSPRVGIFEIQNAYSGGIDLLSVPNPEGIFSPESHMPHHKVSRLRLSAGSLGFREATIDIATPEQRDMTSRIARKRITYALAVVSGTSGNEFVSTDNQNRQFVLYGNQQTRHAAMASAGYRNSYGHIQGHLRLHLHNGGLVSTLTLPQSPWSQETKEGGLGFSWTDKRRLSADIQVGKTQEVIHFTGSPLFRLSTTRHALTFKWFDSEHTYLTITARNVHVDIPNVSRHSLDIKYALPIQEPYFRITPELNTHLFTDAAPTYHFQLPFCYHLAGFKSNQLCGGVESQLRRPTLMELFHPTPSAQGNAQLKNENRLTLHGQFQFTSKGFNTRTRLGVHRIDDMIVYIPVNGFGFRAMNTAHARLLFASHRLQFSFAKQHSIQLILRLRHDLATTTLSRVPNLIPLTASSFYTWHPVQSLWIHLSAQAKSPHHADGNGRLFVPGYFTASLDIDLAVSKTWHLLFKGHNLFNRRQIFDTFLAPQPGTTFFVQLQYQPLAS